MAAVVLTTLTSTGMAGVAFADDDATHKSTPVNTELTANNNPDNPVPPQATDGPENSDQSNNTNDHLNGNFGIAYQPNKFAFSANLNSSGEQKIPVTNSIAKATYDVGVEDKKHDTQGWTLKASFVWNKDSNQIPGASIETSTTGQVMENNNNSSQYDSKLLTPTTMNITEPTDFQIKTTENVVLNAATAKPGTVYNSVYDVDLGKVSFVIPDAASVSTGTYSGNVNWDLSVAPN